MGATTRSVLRRVLNRGFVDTSALSTARFDAIWEQFDQGTQRAVLRLHRSASEGQLARAGAQLDALAMPALVIWGERDPWLPASLGERYGEALANARVSRIADAGHWPWLERPEVADTIAAFVAGR